MSKTVTYYFNDYDSGGEEWGTDPENMVDGDEDTGAIETFAGVVQLCTSNTCDGLNRGEISKVEIRVLWDNGIFGTTKTVLLRSVIGGTLDGDTWQMNWTGIGKSWSDYADITSGTNSPGTWSWSDIKNLDMDVELKDEPGDPTDVYKIEVRVTYQPKRKKSIILIQ